MEFTTTSTVRLSSFNTASTSSGVRISRKPILVSSSRMGRTNCSGYIATPFSICYSPRHYLYYLGTQTEGPLYGLTAEPAAGSHHKHTSTADWGSFHRENDH